jgi:IPT/TIG domain
MRLVGFIVMGSLALASPAVAVGTAAPQIATNGASATSTGARMVSGNGNSDGPRPAVRADHAVTFTTSTSIASAATISELEPSSGPTAGGTRVTIHGDYLENARSVYFGSTRGRIIEEECDGECEIVPYRTLVVESPPHAAGTVDVTVENLQGGMSATSPGDEFTYSASASGPPSEVLTGPAEATPTGFRFKGKLNPDGLQTTYYFEYIGDNEVECLGVDDCWRTTIRVGPIAGDTQQEVPPIEVTGLTVGVAYRYRLVASNADGTERGALATFRATPDGGDDGPNEQNGQVNREPGSKPPTPLIATSSPVRSTTSKPRPPTEAQKLANALKACAGKPPKQRATCRRWARKKDGKAARTGRYAKR